MSATTEEKLELGLRVFVPSMAEYVEGFIRHITNTVVGVQLIGKSVGKGNSNGMYQGVRYFSTKPSNAVFCSRESVYIAHYASLEETLPILPNLNIRKIEIQKPRRHHQRIEWICMCWIRECDVKGTFPFDIIRVISLSSSKASIQSCLVTMTNGKVMGVKVSSGKIINARKIPFHVPSYDSFVFIDLPMLTKSFANTNSFDARVQPIGTGHIDSVGGIRSTAVNPRNISIGDCRLCSMRVIEKPGNALKERFFEIAVLPIQYQCSSELVFANRHFEVMFDDIKLEGAKFLVANAALTHGIIKYQPWTQTLYYFPICNLAVGWFTLKLPFVLPKSAVAVFGRNDDVTIIFMDGELIWKYKFHVDFGKKDHGFRDGRWKSNNLNKNYCMTHCRPWYTKNLTVGIGETQMILIDNAKLDIVDEIEYLKEDGQMMRGDINGGVDGDLLFAFNSTYLGIFDWNTRRFKKVKWFRSGFKFACVDES